MIYDSFPFDILALPSPILVEKTEFGGGTTFCASIARKLLIEGKRIGLTFFQIYPKFSNSGLHWTEFKGVSDINLGRQYLFSEIGQSGGGSSFVPPEGPLWPRAIFEMASLLTLG